MEVVKSSFAGALDQLKDPRFVVSGNQYFATVALQSFLCRRMVECTLRQNALSEPPASPAHVARFDAFCRHMNGWREGASEGPALPSHTAR
jgi:hypothetical protein